MSASATSPSTKTALACVTRQGQDTGRYAKAVEQLGSARGEVRLGGIYALQRLAQDSGRDRPTIVHVLAAYARTRWRRT
ncbi:hypothetical protein [Actinomadura rupiterrae]|uniref:hypothetical protein n=1 Tax=Actinomadura rupiterrae TaxID=559627 RepID=UPI0020A46528|nr:hypothetical protein [Actinomadura rupiterrae]MCP2338702.1 hypothetical protein [Actinomadura rupiterrae]